MCNINAGQLQWSLSTSTALVLKLAIGRSTARRPNEEEAAGTDSAEIRADATLLLIAVVQVDRYDMHMASSKFQKSDAREAGKRRALVDNTV